MFPASSGGANTSPNGNLPRFNSEAVRPILLGDYGALSEAINPMAVLGYCVGEADPEGLPIAWSEPLPTGRNGEGISIMTRHRPLS
jgi:hypothetical protein